MSILGVAGAAVQVGGSLLAGSDPKKDEERKARALNYYNQAKAGSGEAEARLRCYAGELTQAAIDMDILDSAGGCGLAAGSSVARDYAKTLVLKLDAERAVSDVLVGAGATAIHTGATLDPRSIDRALGVPTWLLLLGAAVVGFVLVKKLL